MMVEVMGSFSIERIISYLLCQGEYIYYKNVCIIFKIRSFSIVTLFVRLCVGVGIFPQLDTLRVEV